MKWIIYILLFLSVTRVTAQDVAGLNRANRSLTYEQTISAYETLS